jgi:hypothetical protein
LLFLETLGKKGAPNLGTGLSQIATNYYLFISVSKPPITLMHVELPLLNDDLKNNVFDLLHHNSL